MSHHLTDGDAVPALSGNEPDEWVSPAVVDLFLLLQMRQPTAQRVESVRGRRLNYTHSMEPKVVKDYKRYLVTNTQNGMTNQRFATSPSAAVISESKLYESDDLTFEVREQVAAKPQKFRVTCRTSYDIQEITEDTAVAAVPALS